MFYDGEAGIDDVDDGDSDDDADTCDGDNGCHSLRKNMRHCLRKQLQY